MKKIMFVCTGNTCRSPMAEGFFNHLIAKGYGDNPRLLAESCGLAVFPGMSPAPHSIELLLNEWNIDISSHEATSFEDIRHKDYEYFLTMTTNQKSVILENFPKLKSRVFTLIEFVDDTSDDFDIKDPYGNSYEKYRDCGREIFDYVSRLVDLQTLKEE